MQALIIDDDMATVDAITDTVGWEKLGITRIHAAYNIKSAKKILCENPVDIIISDIEMPQGTGLDLLQWYRREIDGEGEFLLLTNHERFDYAANAVKFQAAEYLLKPFDASVLEAALKKIIIKVDESRQLKLDSEYGKWAKKNQRQLMLAFWNKALTGYVAKSENELREANADLNPEIDVGGDYFLVVSKVTDIEADKGKLTPDLLVFMLENIHSEVLCGNPENDSVILQEYQNHYIVISVCRADTEQPEARCGEMIRNFDNVLDAVVTCCISKPCKIWEFRDTFRRVLRLIETNVACYGGFFREEQAVDEQILIDNLLDSASMEECLNKKNKIELLNYLKGQINNRVFQHTLSGQVLRQVKHRNVAESVSG